MSKKFEINGIPWDFFSLDFDWLPLVLSVSVSEWDEEDSSDDKSSSWSLHGIALFMAETNKTTQLASYWNRKPETQRQIADEVDEPGFSTL